MELFEIKLPQKGMGMVDGDIIEWKVKEGDHINKGDELVEVETAKTSFVLEATLSGKINSIVRKEDETVEVGEVIATVIKDES